MHWTGPAILSKVSLSTLLFSTLLVSAWLAPSAQAQTSTTNTTSASGSAAGAQPFDVKAAVDAYLGSVPPEKRARSDAYFEGGYWLLLWDFLATIAVMWILLRWRWSVRMRDLAERLTRFKALQAGLYWVQFIVVASVITFPLTVYEGYFREHKYGLSNQTFGQWMRDQAVGLALSAVLGAILLALLFGAVRRLGKSWWVWGSVLSLIFIAFVIFIAPVFIAPLFNKYTKLEDPRIKDPILSLARANGIPATDVYEFDESRQSDRVSANVSGFAGTTRISLNDNLLKRCSLPGIEATMGHEMGHYVLNHSFKGLVLNGVVLVIMFALLDWGLAAGLARWGESWGIRGITDLAVVPLAVMLLTTFSFLLTPVNNTITRTMEYEADMYGINASQQPDGEAEVDLLLGEYRKLDPGRIEEFIFFDHPSGRTRITAAMRWKAEHLPGAPLGPPLRP
ncbi:MAG: M48 family metallopeptidase [Terriglobales bacterium]